MRQLRRVHAFAAIVTSAAAGLAVAGAPGAALGLIVLSILLLVWSLEQLRDAINRSRLP